MQPSESATMQTIDLPSVVLTVEPDGLRITHKKTGGNVLIPLAALDRWALSQLRKLLFT